MLLDFGLLISINKLYRINFQKNEKTQRPYLYVYLLLVNISYQGVV